MNPQDSVNGTQWNTVTEQRFILTVISAINTHIATPKNIRTRTAQHMTPCANPGSIKNTEEQNHEHIITADSDYFRSVIAGRKA